MRARRIAFPLFLTSVTALTALTVGAGPAAHATHGGNHHDGHSQELRHHLAKAKEATARYRDERTALAAGYRRTDVCVSSSEGGMGYHYVKEAYIGSTDPAKPAVLVFVPGKDGKRKLGALEYVVVDKDGDVNTDHDRPRAFGRGFDGPMPGHEPQMPVHYDLHVWLWKHNPDGLLAMWNPDVRCPVS